MSEVVRVEIDERMAVITIDRPEARNALNSAVRRELPAAIARAEADDDVDVMILTGADPAFCAGVDLKEFGSGAATERGDGFAEIEGRDAGGRGSWRGALPPHRKLLIGAVNGVAITGGLEVALNCDFLIGSDRARFADTHARVGVMPGWGLTVLLSQRIGVARARQMSVTGNFVDATTAYEWGLLNEVVAHDALLDRAKQLARDCTTIDQRAVREILETYQLVSDTTVDEGWTIEDRRSREWEGAGFDPAEIERKRHAIMARGRTQL
jgi:enoyl-CoA hydratase